MCLENHGLRLPLTPRFVLRCRLLTPRKPRGGVETPAAVAMRSGAAWDIRLRFGRGLLASGFPGFQPSKRMGQTARAEFEHVLTITV